MYHNDIILLPLKQVQQFSQNCTDKVHGSVQCKWCLVADFIPDMCADHFWC